MVVTGDDGVGGGGGGGGGAASTVGGESRTRAGRLVGPAAAAVVLLVAWWGWLRFGGAPEATRRAVSDVGFVLAPGVACWSGLRVARRDPESARAWRWMAAGCGTWSVASVVWAVYELGLGQLAPFPSWADVGYVGYVIPMGIGLWSLPHLHRLRTSRLRSVLDAAVIASSVLVISWSLVLREVFQSPTESLWVECSR